ncbi:MAG: phosphotransferase [Campylobacterota bacterium]|nr:phosphotransferase [Campylobacterota bacterium]
MGVKTLITLDEVNKLFDSYNFKNLKPTSSGIIDTTYIVDNFILKKYERDIKTKIDEDIKLLSELKAVGLSVPTCQDRNGEWYLYEKLQGEEPNNIKSYHIQAVARFLAKFHSFTYKKSSNSNLIDQDEITSLLNYTKSNFFGYYKRLQFLKKYNIKNDGLIHGDIFKDNTLFLDSKIGVFDFIDSADGSFNFECGVALVGFGIKKNRNFFINLFLHTYNQHAPKKIEKKELLEGMDMACGFYALKRIYRYKNTKKAKKLSSCS